MDQEVRHDTVFDTGAEHLGRVYAEALLGAAGAAGVGDIAVAQLMELVDGVLLQNPSLAVALSSPRISSDEKKRIIERLFGGQVDPMLLRFLKVVAEHGRLGYLRHIALAARDQRDVSLGRTMATVKSAVPLTDELRESVRTHLASTLGREIVLREMVDPQLIGGLVIQVGDTVYDGSVSGRLAGMAKQARHAFARKMLENSDRFAAGSLS